MSNEYKIYLWIAGESNSLKNYLNTVKNLKAKNIEAKNFIEALIPIPRVSSKRNMNPVDQNKNMKIMSALSEENLDELKLRHYGFSYYEGGVSLWASLINGNSEDRILYEIITKGIFRFLAFQKISKMFPDLSFKVKYYCSDYSERGFEEISQGKLTACVQTCSQFHVE